MKILQSNTKSIKSNSYGDGKNNVSPDLNIHAKDTISCNITSIIHAKNHGNLQSDLKNIFLHSVMSGK